MVQVDKVLVLYDTVLLVQESVPLWLIDRERMSADVREHPWIGLHKVTAASRFPILLHKNTEAILIQPRVVHGKLPCGVLHILVYKSEHV